jgi:hypothetical protein
MKFTEKFAEMGLTQKAPDTYEYSDQYSSVIYEGIKTCDSDAPIPLLSIWTKGPAPAQQPIEEEKYSFQGLVSLAYNFTGNEAIKTKVRESISEINTPIFREYTTLNAPRYTMMHSDILIQNVNNVPEIGDVYPQVTIRNSYDGRLGIEVSFGISLLNDNLRNALTFRKVLSSFKQIHSQYAKTKLSSAVGDYIEVVSTNILDLIKTNFETPVTEEALMATLDLVEEIGQKRRVAISDVITKITEGKSFVSCWDLFLAITKFSTVEKNLNAKVLLEDIVERTLVVPVKMIEMMKEINKE